MPAAAWPIDDVPAARDHHRVVHVFSTRWCRLGANDAELPVTWEDAERLRKITPPGAPDPWPLARSFREWSPHLKRQYARVEERMPSIVGRPLAVTVGHRARQLEGHCFIARLSGGHLLICVSLAYDGPLRELPDEMIHALEEGPKLPVTIHGDQHSVSLQECVNDRIDWASELRDELRRQAAADETPQLLLSSEMHSMVFVRDGDLTLVRAPRAANWLPESMVGVSRDQLLIRRLLGRLPGDADSIRDPGIQWPGELNRGARTVGAVRPGASVLAGHGEPVYRNAFVSLLLLMGSATLLREARDETWSVLTDVEEKIREDRHNSSWRGFDPYARDQTRLALVQIAVAFHVETHLDIRRVISDAYLSDFHRCTATALAIPQSVQAIQDVTSRLEAAVRTAGTRATNRTYYIVSILVAVIVGSLAIVVDLIQ